MTPDLTLICIVHIFSSEQTFLPAFYSKGLEILKNIKKQINVSLFHVGVFPCFRFGFVFGFFPAVFGLQQKSLDFLKFHFEIKPLLVYIYF